MLYKFKSPAGADVIMNQSPGRHILEVIGKDPDATSGIITPEQIPDAIAALRAEVARQEAERAQARAAQPAGEEDTRDDHDNGVVLFAQRVAPFIRLLELSLAERQNVVWGV